jgi:Tol biopolymer transport system component
VQSRRSIVLGFVALYAANGGSCLAQASNSPQLFAPGVISGPADDLSPAFAPDGKTVVFTRSNGTATMIVTSTFAHGRWSAPTVAPFSGHWRDFEPTMSPDGSFLVFASNRPGDGTTKPLDGNFDHKTFPEGGGHLWRVDFAHGRWGTPVELPAAINSGTSVFSPSVSADGSIYFMRPDSATGLFHLFRSQARGATYLAATPVGVGDATTEDVDPAVAPNERYLVFSSNHPDQHVPKRLRIAFRSGDGWGAPVDLGDEVNESGSNIEARLSPDGRTLYFSTNTVPPSRLPRSDAQAKTELIQMEVWANGRENIWYVSLAPWLASAPPTP